MQQVRIVDLFDGVEKAGQNVDHEARRQRLFRRFEDIEQVVPLDQVDDHIGRAVFLENAVHADDVGVTQFCKALRLADEHLDHRTELFFVIRRSRDDILAAAHAVVFGKAFLQNNRPAKRIVGGAIGDAEATRAHLLGDRELIAEQVRPVRKSLPRRQFRNH